jgi:hypothetical protein
MRIRAEKIDFTAELITKRWTHRIYIKKTLYQYPSQYIRIQYDTSNLIIEFDPTSPKYDYDGQILRNTNKLSAYFKSLLEDLKQ